VKVDNAGDVVKVGDSTIDIEEGQNAGCGISVGITTGAHTYDQLLTANPDYIIDDLLDLLPIIELR
jgi:phosphoglycolate phosphatase-like HAD superfamily hydrolase